MEAGNLLEILVATHNAGKLAELRAIASPWPVRLLGLADRGIELAVEEDGDTFDQNALIKALALHQAAGGWVMADDSGLCVDALDGAPGVHSARFAGPDATDEDKVSLLLEALDGLEEEKRGAAFHCSLALVSPDGRARIYRGKTRGSIAFMPCGEAGFGYDPIFIAAGGQRTLAQMSPKEKDAISHRGRALRELLQAEFPPGETGRGDL